MSAEKLPVTVEDSINAAFDEIEGKNEEVDTPPADEPPVEQVETRARADDGKFVKKPKEKVVKEEITEEVKAKPEAPKYKAPKAWETDPTLKADYDKLPEHIKVALDKREKEVEYGFTKLDEERNFGKQIKEVITPYMPIITAEGGTPAKAVESLLNTAYLLRTAPPAQKAALIQQIAQQYGVDLAQIPQQEQVDPALKQVLDRINGIEQKITQTSTLQERQDNDKVMSEIQAFAADSRNVHYAAVENSMAPHLAQIKAENPLMPTAEILQEAYHAACWANPQVRSILIDQQKAEEAAKRNAEIAKKKQASSSVTGSPGLKTNASTSKKSIEEELADVYDDLTGSRI